MTAAVWARGILADDYGVRAADVEWVQGGLEEPGRLPFEPAEPAGVTVGFAPADRSLAQMLESGEIDALVTARTPSTFRRGGSAVRRLFEHPFEVERDYFRRTGIFPIMHTLVVKKEILEANPWVAFTLFKAFSEAKDLAMADVQGVTRSGKRKADEGAKRECAIAKPDHRADLLFLITSAH
jgi:4,5-dihydroxyphthalate decarboxylase